MALLLDLPNEFYSRHAWAVHTKHLTSLTTDLCAGHFIGYVPKPWCKPLPIASCRQAFGVMALPYRFQHAPPSQIILQIMRRHTMEAAHPVLLPTVIGIDVLNVVRPSLTRLPGLACTTTWVMQASRVKRAQTAAPSVQRTASGSTSGFSWEAT